MLSGLIYQTDQQGSMNAPLITITSPLSQCRNVFTVAFVDLNSDRSESEAQRMPLNRNSSARERLITDQHDRAHITGKHACKAPANAMLSSVLRAKATGTNTNKHINTLIFFHRNMSCRNLKRDRTHFHKLHFHEL